MLEPNNVGCDIGNLSVHDHPCSIYDSPDDLKRGFVPFLQTGLLLGERCVYFVDENTTDFVIDAMRANDFDLEPYSGSGAFVVISTRDAHLKGGYFGEEKMLEYWNSALEETRSGGYKAMRAAVEMTWALSGNPGCEILAPYEARLTRFTDANPVSVICMYSRKKFSPEKLKAIIHAHPIVVDVDEVLENPCCVKPDLFVEDDTAQDVRAMLDNLAMAKALRKAHEELKASHDEFQNLCYVVSHELQEPLVSLKSYQNLLASRYRGRLGKDADEFISECAKSVDTIDSMINDLWSFARVAMPRKHPGKISLTRVLETAMRQLAPLLKETDADVQCSELPDVWGVDEQLTIVFSELLQNAIMHNISPRPVVKVSSEHLNGYAHIVVEDNGEGIDQVNRNQAFQLFNRLGKRPGFDGTGMGLPICKKIVEHHGGAITVERSENGGTLVRLSLPKSNNPETSTVTDMAVYRARQP